MNYYISSDLNDGFIYIAPLGKVDRSFLIRFPNKYNADEYLRKLTAKLVKDPNQDEKAYELLEVVTHPVIPGKVHVFGLK
jgi:hypothetical protein